MRQHIEIITKVKAIKETATKSGKYLYSFGIPVSKMVGENQVTEWVNVSILQDTQRRDVTTATEVHIIGELTLREAWGNRPQGVGIFGFFIEPVLSQVYRQRKTKSNAPQPAQAPNPVQDVPQQAQSGYSDPVAAVNPQSEYIPM